MNESEMTSSFVMEPKPSLGSQPQFQVTFYPAVSCRKRYPHAYVLQIFSQEEDAKTYLRYIDKEMIYIEDIRGISVSLDHIDGYIQIDSSHSSYDK
jgi:hypothetical protein